jgi:type II secretory ATPase GspE/PulE/Tfp pilus assembly ATPase PilB-like protein
MSEDARTLEERSTQRRAHLLNMPYEDTSAREIPLYPSVLPVPELYSLKAIPLYYDTSNLRFGVTNTTSQSTMANLRMRFPDQQVTFAIISDNGFKDLMARYDPPKQVVYKDISLVSHDANDQFKVVSETLNSVRADDMLAYVVQQAYLLKASDIHMETDEASVRIRFRVDGVLHPIAELSNDKYRQFLSSLAVAANVSTSSDQPQTGHINRAYELANGSNVTVNLRLETVPAVHGMDAVLRLFNLKPELMKLDSLGLSGDEKAIIDDIISHPNGLVLMVGPTGSGKTTTLYSILNQLNSPERKIITLEDPVEYNIKGITQIPVDSQKEENGFAEKFRAVLRLDPDVIMVGEIRDLDTAKTALQSALTGHLVLSTYHAGSSAAALTRMLDAIGDNPLFSSAIRLITAQRLIRRLDEQTKVAYEPDAKTVQWLRGIIETFPSHAQRPTLDNIKLYKPGSSAKNPFGYSGQIAVRELMLMTPNIMNELKKSARDITAVELEKIAVSDGMLTMLHNGVLNVIEGKTSLEEVVRILA